MSEDHKGPISDPVSEAEIAPGLVPANVDEISRKLRRKVLLKIDLVILPILFIAQFLSFLDKNGLAYAAIYGMQKDAHLVGQEYSWLGSIFYFGYLAMEFPTMWLLTKVPIGKYIGVSIIGFGLVLCCMTGAKSFAGLAAARFVLGMFEAGLLPSFIILNSVWYRREEQPLRTAIWWNTFAGIFGGILSYAIGHIVGPLSTWKYIFIIYGAISMFLGIVTLFVLPDSAQNAWFLTAEEKQVAFSRTAANQTGVNTHRSFKLSQVLEALADPKYWVMVIFAIAQALTNAGVTNFNPLIISGYGFSTSKTALMASPQAAVAFIAQVSCTVLTFFVPNIRCLLWVLSCLPALAGAIMIRLLDPTLHRDASLTGVYLMGFYNPSWILMLSLQSSNTAGMTKKSFVSGSVAVCYAIGNIIGPQFFRASQKPHYQLGIGAMLCAFCIMAGMGILYWIICVYQNSVKNRAASASAGSSPETQKDDLAHVQETEVQDLTDVQNPTFRYTY
ncbi:MFS general substrate transporter [Xylona heveae TC161]|uniref:MFS general substrate transporter n=1 Tax=Xylona heveae (strain CBS 132557 / TC161) TaxID=1328760 RepID=A0A165JGE4_XYLHT|nr:MFS general substrate transporter [Xylona heveae TC161]KZF26202.1 MFS general substrate transporter [Xylona heveae TC161]